MCNLQIFCRYEWPDIITSTSPNKPQKPLQKQRTRIHNNELAVSWEGFFDRLEREV